MSQISRLSSLIQMRMYTKLKIEIDQQIRKNGWFNVIKNLRAIRGSAVRAQACLRLPRYGRTAYRSSGFTKGSVRNGLVRTLELESVTGIDVDILNVFSDIEGKTLPSVIEGIHDKSIEILSDQIKRNDTFYLDVHGMLSTPFFQLVDDIVKTRKTELLQVGKNPHLNDIVSTYYGFSLAIEGSIISEERGFTRTTKFVLEELSRSWGSVIVAKGKRVTYKPKLFPNCSDEKASFLADVLTLSLAGGGSSALHHAIHHLGRLGDSRSVELMSRRLLSPAGKINRSDLIWALAAIGDNEGFEILRDFSQRKHEIAISAIMGLGHIRSPESLQYLIEMSKTIFMEEPKWTKGMVNRMSATLLALGINGNPISLPILEDAIRLHKGFISIEGSIALDLLKSKNRKIDRNHIDMVTDMIRGSESLWLVRLLTRIPKMLKRSEISKAITDRIQVDENFARGLLSIFSQQKKSNIPKSIIKACTDSLKENH